ncbi:MAG: bifunctional anthranilate synthase component II/anthranilate phosphoribosyltransferase, partial [Treponemataceae bacterium]|nr:bifunctional anthranilate synthase component II/anthranilate phosphoribosyltransferase [Treponemataceae bacterium]
MIVVVDNYDSFTFNVVQSLERLSGDTVTVVRSKETSVADIESLKPDYLVISPGPGTPSEAGISIEAIRHFAGKVPILGICLGHQAICEVYGATITYARELMHGKQSIVTLDQDSRLF